MEAMQLPPPVPPVQTIASSVEKASREYQWDGVTVAFFDVLKAAGPYAMAEFLFAVVTIVAMLAFVYYKIKTHASRADAPAPHAAEGTTVSNDVFLRVLDEQARHQENLRTSVEDLTDVVRALAAKVDAQDGTAERLSSAVTMLSQQMGEFIRSVLTSQKLAEEARDAAARADRPPRRAKLHHVSA